MILELYTRIETKFWSLKLTQYRYIILQTLIHTYVHSITQGKGLMITWWLVGRGNYQGSNQFIDDDKFYQERVKYVKSLTDLQLNNSQSDKSKSHPNVLY